MVYKWGNIKRSIVKYCRNAFAENGIPVSDGQIELNVEIFNNILSQKTGHALIDGLDEKLKPALQRACVDEVGNIGDVNTILTSLDAFIKVVLLLSGRKNYHDIERLTLMPLIKETGIIPLPIPQIDSTTISRFFGTVRFIVGKAYLGRNQVHNSPDWDISEVTSYLKYGLAFYILIVQHFKSDMLTNYPQIADSNRFVDYTTENNGILLYEFFGFGTESNKLKNRIVNTLILHSLYGHEDMSFEELKVKVNTLFSNSVKDSFLRRRVDELISKDFLKRNPANKHIGLEAKSVKRMEDMINEYNANSTDFMDKLSELLKKYSLENKMNEVIPKILSFFEDNFNIDLLETFDESSDATSFNNYQLFLDELSSLGSTSPLLLFKEILALCKRNDFLIRLSLGKVYSNISNPDQFDNTIRQLKRTTYLDTQILLYALCVNDDYITPDNPIFNIAKGIVEISDSRTNIELKTQRPYVDEIAFHLKEALLLIPFEEMKIFEGPQFSDNVFYKHYYLLKDKDSLPEGIDSFADYLENNFNIKESDAYSNDYELIAQEVIEGKLEDELNINIEDKKVDKNDKDFVRSKKAFVKALPENKSRSEIILDDDAAMGQILFNNKFDVEPFFLTWDKSFARYREVYINSYIRRNTMSWKFFSPGKFLNHLDLLDFKIDSSKLSDEMLAMIEVSAYKQHTLKILDVFNKYIGIAVQDKAQRKKYAQMTKEVFKDSDFAQRIEDERADDSQNNFVRFSKIIVKLFEHYKNLNILQSYNKVLGIEDCFKELLDKIRNTFSRANLDIQPYVELLDKYIESEIHEDEEINKES